MTRVLITEAHDGLGLALVKEYLADADNQVVAFCGDETKCDQLNTLRQTISDQQLLIVPVNLADEDSIKASVAPIEDFVDALDLLIFNPGAMSAELYIGDWDYDGYKGEFTDYYTILRKTPDWIYSTYDTLLLQGTNPKIIGIKAYTFTHYTPQWYGGHGKHLYGFYRSFSIGLYKIAKKVESTTLVVADLSRYELLDTHIVDEYTFNILEGCVLLDKKAIYDKARAIFLTIPKISMRKHIYFEDWYKYV